MVEPEDGVSGVHQPFRDRLVVPDPVLPVVRRSVDIDGRVVVAIEEVGSCRTGFDRELGVAGQAEAQGVEAVEPPQLQLAVAGFAQGRKPLRPRPRAAGGPGRGTGEFGQRIADRMTVQKHVVGLIPVIQQALVTSLAARIGLEVVERIRVEVADFKGAPGEGRYRSGVVDELPQHPRASLRGFVEKYLAPVIGRGHRLGGQFPRLELVTLPYRFAEGRLKRRHLRLVGQRFEGDDEHVPGVDDIGHDPGFPTVGRGVVPVFPIGFVARPVPFLQVENEPVRLVRPALRPAQVDAVEIRGVPIAQAHDADAIDGGFAVASVHLAADLREPVGADKPVAEALPLLLVAGDALHRPQADVLHADEIADKRFLVQARAASLANLRQVDAFGDMRVPAARATLHDRGGKAMGGLDLVRSEIQIHLVGPVPGAFVIDQRPRAELRYGKEPGPRDELVAAGSQPPAGHIGRQRQPGEIVTRQEALGSKIPPGIEVAPIDAFGLGEQPYLALGLGAEAPRMGALGFGARRVPDNPVMQLALPDGGAVKPPPAIAGGFERLEDPVQNLADPVFAEPCRGLQLPADALDESVGPLQGRGAQRGIVERTPDRGFYGQSDGAVLVADIEQARQSRPEAGVRHFRPDRVNVRTDEVPVAQVDARRRHRPRHHVAGPSVIVLVVGASTGAIGVDQRRLAAPSGASAALCVVRRRRGDVPQVDQIELGYVDPEFHGRRTEQQREPALPEARLALFPVLGRNLRRVLAGFEETFDIHEAPVAFQEVAVGAGRDFSDLEQPRPVVRARLAVAGDPAQRAGIDPVAVRAADPFENPVPRQGAEQETDGPVDVLPDERPAGVRISRQTAPDVAAQGAPGRYEEAGLVFAGIPAPTRAGPGDRGFRQLARVVETPHGPLEKAGLRLSNELLLLAGIERIDLDRQLLAQHVEQRPQDFLA